jgi:hypothetical protein
MAADSAQAQMNPPTAGFQAFLAAFRTGRDAPDLVEMITLFHCFTPDLVLGIDVWSLTKTSSCVAQNVGRPQLDAETADALEHNMRVRRHQHHAWDADPADNQES